MTVTDHSRRFLCARCLRNSGMLRSTAEISAARMLARAGTRQQRHGRRQHSEHNEHGQNPSH
jgi:hypothetical protein